MTTETFSTCSFSSRLKYDVFLSFSEETSKSFTDHLNYALNKKGINTFKEDDENDLNKRRKAIEESRFAIVVLSKAYVSSIWCLDELAKIVERKEELKKADGVQFSSTWNQYWDIVYPIFYQVDARDVRKQKGFVGEAFEKHEQVFKHSMETVIKWRNALSQVADLGGWHLRNYSHESDVIQKIVQDISKNLKRYTFACGNDDDSLVGMDSRMKKIDLLLDLKQEEEVRVIGICGVKGIGKTTIAVEVFRRISHKFNNCAFIPKVRQEIVKNGKIKLQEYLYKVLLDTEEYTMNDDIALNLIGTKLKSKRVLIVLDDVDQLEQIEDLVGNWRKQDEWLGPGSRVLVTTTKKYLLSRFGEENIYEVDKLTKHESLTLLCQKAFEGNDRVLDDYRELSNNVIEYAEGRPSILENLGSFLFGRTIDEWSSTIAKLMQNPEFSEQFM